MQEGVNSVDGVRGALRPVAVFETLEKIIDGNELVRGGLTRWRVE